MTIVAHKINGKQKIRDFIEYIGQPFDAADVELATDLPYKTVANNLRIFEKKGLIKGFVRKNGKIYVKRTSKEVYEDKRSESSSEMILRLLSGGNAMSIREMAGQLLIGRATVIKWTKRLLESGRISRRKRDRITYEYYR